MAFLYGGSYVPMLGAMVAYTLNLSATAGWLFRRRHIAEHDSHLLLARDLDLANQIQDSLAPPETREFLGKFIIRCLQLKHDALGGDWMAVRDGEVGEVFLAVGDATVKGVQAALVVHAVQSLWAERLADPRFDPVNFLNCVNSTLFVLGKRQPHTLTLGILRMHRDELTYWSAGHVPVVIFQGGKTTRLSASGGMLGLYETLQLNVVSRKLEGTAPDLAILLASDGVLNGSKSMTARSVKQVLDGLALSGAPHLETLTEPDDKTLILVQRAA